MWAIIVALCLVVSEALVRQQHGFFRRGTSKLALLPAEEAMIELFAKVRPSVVYISTLSRQFNPVRFNIMEIPSQTGSGFVWDSRHVVTNAHVLQAGRPGGLSSKSDETFLVTLLEPSLQSYRCRIKGIDADKDVAVLELLPPSTPDSAAPNLVPLQLGSSAALRVGQTAIAIGNPFGLDLTLTTGVVSGLGRTVGLTASRALFDMVQTDASINPGNSGGPLLDSSGQIIGMNTAIYTTSGTSGGIGFAIPVDTLKVVVDLLIKDGALRKADTGLSLLGGAAAQLVGISKGLLVARVAKGSLGEAAGLRGEDSGRTKGDVILQVNGLEVNVEADFARAVNLALGDGEVVGLRISRAIDDGAGKVVRRDVDVKLRLRR